MSGILRLESLTRGNTLRQGDLTLLKYRLFDADGDKLDISGKTATVRLMKNDFTFIAYEKEGLTVAPDDTISFSVNKILPGGLYHLEVIVDDKYIFPSRDDEGKINIDKSSLGADITIVETAGVEAVARKATGMMKQDEEFIDDMTENVISDSKVQSFAQGIDAKATNALSLSESADTLSKSVQEQFNQVVIEGDSSVEAAQARVDASGKTNPTLKARLDKEHKEVTAQLADIAVNAKSYGLSENATWEVNRDALQAANDYVASKGGGTVLIPPGIYNVKGVIQDSNVEFTGGGTLNHPDGLTGDIITSRLYSTKAITTAGQKAFTVSDASNIRNGAMIAIRAAGGKSVRQNTATTQAITSASTSVTIASATGFHSDGYGWIGNEVIGWTLSGTTMTLQRGLFGTTPTSHALGTVVHQAVRFYAEVQNVQGNTITVNIAVPHSLTDVDISIGIVNPKINDIEFIGNKTANGSSGNPIAVRWQLVKGGQSKGVVSRSGDLGGFMLTQGASGNIIEDLTVIDSGIPSIGKGAGLWLFQGCRNNKVVNLNVKGYCYNGIYLDDRTVVASEWDAECDYNVFENPSVDIIRNGSNTCLNVTGSNNNKFNNATFKGGYSGFVLASNQNNNVGNTNPPAQGNIFNNVTIIESHLPYSVTTKGNTLNNVNWVGTAVPPADVGSKLINTGTEYGIEHYPVGYRWLNDGISADALRVVSHTMILIPFKVDRHITLKELGVEVTATVETESTARVAIYNTDENGLPASINWDSGLSVTFDGTGIKYVTLDRFLMAGNYFIGLVFRNIKNYLNAPYLASVKGFNSQLPESVRPTLAKPVSGYTVSGGGEGTVVSNPATQRGTLTSLEVIPAVYIKSE